MESQLRLDLVIEGRVQGVGFRVSTKMEAESLDIRGSVQNVSDGSVFVIALGEKIAMENFLSWCYKGPSSAIVKKIKVFRGKTEEFNEFRVIY